jgi:hypothetical protein
MLRRVAPGLDRRPGVSLMTRPLNSIRWELVVDIGTVDEQRHRGPVAFDGLISVTRQRKLDPTLHWSELFPPPNYSRPADTLHSANPFLVSGLAGSGAKNLVNTSTNTGRKAGLVVVWNPRCCRSGCTGDVERYDVLGLAFLARVTSDSGNSVPNGRGAQASWTRMRSKPSLDHTGHGTRRSLSLALVRSIHPSAAQVERPELVVAPLGVVLVFRQTCLESTSCRYRNDVSIVSYTRMSLIHPPSVWQRFDLGCSELAIFNSRWPGPVYPAVVAAIFYLDILIYWGAMYLQAMTISP